MRGQPDRLRSLAKYRRIAPRYDRGVTRFSGRTLEPLRLAAVRHLDLKPGDRVVDAGCGTGLSFGALSHVVGPEGHVIGVDQSPDMLELAIARIAREGLSNVTVVEGAGQDRLDLGDPADALFAFFVHDLVRTPAALANLLGSIRDGGTVVSAGARLGPWWAAPVSVAWLAMIRRYVTTFEGIRRPWDRLAAMVPDLDVRLVWAGFAYIAAGHVDHHSIRRSGLVSDA